MADCGASGCRKKVVAKGYCQTHYMRQRRNGHVNDTRIGSSSRVRGHERICSDCEKWLPIAAFNKGHSADGLKIYCKQCEKYQRAKSKYKLSADAYEEMLQRGCAICGDSDSSLVIDHDHACCPGQEACGSCVRSALCITCNVRLGVYEDRNWISKADEYLRSFIVRQHQS